MTTITQEQNAESQPVIVLTRAERIFYKGLAVAFIIFFFAEVVLRAIFSWYPVNIQSDMQSVRLVPWLRRPTLYEPQGSVYGYPYNSIPYNIDMITQVRLPPGLKDHQVLWGEVRFHVSTVSVWEGHGAGFRTTPIQYPLDVMTFGDNFTFCWTEYEDCWVTQLGKRYGSWFNAAVPGTGTAGQYGLMEQIVPPTKPRLVIWIWYADDLRDTYRHDIIRTGAAPFHYNLPLINPSPKAENAQAMFASVRLFNSIFGLLPDPNHRVVSANNRALRVATPERPHPASLEWAANRYGLYRAQDLFDKARQFLRETVGAELLIVLIPTKEEAFGKALSKVLGDAYVEPIGAARRALIEHLEAQGFHYIDALPAFQAAIERGESVYYDRIEYLNPSGNRVLAELVANYIESKNLLPPR
ncbi:MAG: hypothetical protein RML95_09335 [Anaerolineae bacterium]|nr:hypothetical protein [Anaerolineae bacterium]